MTSVPRVVLDTNVLASALVLSGGRATRVRTGWQAGAFVPLASAATARELVRVLQYPKFKLTAQTREDVLADYLPWVEVVRIPSPPPKAPACRGAFDIPFLELAAAGRAQVLVTGDHDLLALAGHTTTRYAILALNAFCDAYLSGE